MKTTTKTTKATKTVDTKKVSKATTTTKGTKMKTTKTTKTTKATVLKINATIKKSITTLITSHNKVISANETLDNNSLKLFNIIIKESIALKKEVVTNDTIKDINDYKYNQISKALKALKEDKYYHGIVDITTHYLKSGYSVMFLDTVKLSTIRKMLDIKPIKANVKKCKNNQELETLINTVIATTKTAKQKAIKDSLSSELKAILAKLSDSDKIALRAYYTL